MAREEIEITMTVSLDVSYLPGCRQTWNEPGEEPGWELCNPAIKVGKKEVNISEETFDEIKDILWPQIENQLENL